MTPDQPSSMTEQTSSDTKTPNSSEFQRGIGQISSPEGAGMGGAATSSAQAHESGVSSQTPESGKADPSAGAQPTPDLASPDVELKDPQLEVSTAREPGERGESKE